jgi:predicted ATPase
VHYRRVTPNEAPVPGPDKRSFSRLCPDRSGRIDRSRWPATVPAVAQILAEGLELPAGVTVLVGENGSGKSTVIEVIAEACGLNPQGGWTADRFRTRSSEPGIGQHLWVDRGPGWPTWAYFLRADTMHELFTYLEDNPDRRARPLHELSRGEGFLEILRSRINQPGLYLLDEPDAPLSFVASSRCCTTSARRVLRSSSRLIRRSSPPCPARGCSSSAAGEYVRPAGRTWSSSRCGGSISGGPVRSCATSSRRSLPGRPLQPLGPAAVRRQ